MILALRVRACPLLLAAAILAATAAPAAAMAPAPVASRSALSWLPAGVRPAVAAAEARVSGTRTALASPSYVTKIGAVISAAGAALPEVPALPAPDAAHLARVAALSPDVAGAVAGLEMAVDQGSGEMGDIPAADLRAFSDSVAPLLGSIDSRPRALAPQRQTVSWHPARIAAPQPAASPAIRRALLNAPTAALRIAAALDAYVPALRAHRLEVRPLAAAADGCDVIDQAPLLCVASAADNTLTANAALTIDLGGNDTWLSTAGGAPFPSGQAAYAPISLAVVLGGNDTFRAPTIGGISSYGLQVGQGAGYGGGLGMLVKLEGDDHFISAAPVIRSGTSFVAVTQGSALGGYGILLDRGGNESYEATAPDGLGSYSILAQGAAIFCPGTVSTNPADLTNGCATGALVHEGEGNDSYLLDAGTVTPNAGIYGVRVGFGQGASEFADAILMDDGGHDSFVLRAGASQTGRSAYLAPSVTPNAVTEGQGFSAPGYALLLEGYGDSSYTNAVTGTGFVMTSAWGQGFSAGGTPLGMNDGYSLAALDDQGGRDTFSLTDRVAYRMAVTVADSCHCSRASATVKAYTISPPAWVLGQGNGGFDGIAILHDHAGPHHYEAVSSLDLAVTLRDTLSHPAGPPQLEVHGYSQAALQAQGFTTAGIGLLQDEGGPNTFNAISDNHVSGTATSAHAGGTPVVRAESNYSYAAIAQGAGNNVLSEYPFAGALLDLGSSAGTFYARATEAAATGPGGLALSERCFPAFQGAGFAGVFVAQGPNPLVISDPSQGVDSQSSGSRGFGDWVNLPRQGTLPENQVMDVMWFVPSHGRSTATGTAPIITYVSIPAGVRRGTVVPITLRLTDWSARPIAGGLLHLDLQAIEAGAPPFDPTSAPIYVGVQGVDGVTGRDGTVTVMLPLVTSIYNGYTGKTVDTFTGLPFRLLATFDGGPGLLPRHVVMPLQLS